MPEFTERVQRVVEEYPELQDVSDDAVEALALAAGLNILDELREEVSRNTEVSKERLEKLGVDLEKTEERPDSE